MGTAVLRAEGTDQRGPAGVCDFSTASVTTRNSARCGCDVAACRRRRSSRGANQDFKSKELRAFPPLRREDSFSSAGGGFVFVSTEAQASRLCSNTKFQGPESATGILRSDLHWGHPHPCPRAQEPHFIPARGRQSLLSLGAAGCRLPLAPCPTLQPPGSLPTPLRLLCRALLRLPSAGPTPAGEDPQHLKKPLGRESCCGMPRDVLPGVLSKEGCHQ